MRDSYNRYAFCWTTHTHTHTRTRCVANEPGVRLRRKARPAPRSDRWEFSQESPLSSPFLLPHPQKAARYCSLSVSKQTQAYQKGSVSISKYCGRQVDLNMSSRWSLGCLNGCHNCQRKEKRIFLRIRQEAQLENPYVQCFFTISFDVYFGITRWTHGTMKAIISKVVLGGKGSTYTVSLLTSSTANVHKIDLNVWSNNASVLALPTLLPYTSFPSVQSQPWSPPTPTPLWLRRVRRRRWAALLTERNPSWCAGRRKNASSTRRPADTWSPSKRWLTKSSLRWWWALSLTVMQKYFQSNFFNVQSFLSIQTDGKQRGGNSRESMAKRNLAQIHSHNLKIFKQGIKY